MIRWRGLLAWLLVLLAACTVLPADARSASRPDKATLRKKTTKQLKKLLRDVGATCHKCTQKDDYVERILDTWDWGPAEVSSPDGTIKMDKDTFIKQLKASLSEAQNQEREGHEVEDVDPSSLPDLEEVWRDFSERLARGEISTDAGGQVKYELNMPADKESWSKYRLVGMMAVNFVVLVCLRRMKASEKRRKELEAQVQRHGKPSSQAPGEALPDISEDDVADEGKERHSGGKRGAAGKHKGNDKKAQDGVVRKRHA